MGLIQLKQVQPLVPSNQTNTKRKAPLLLDTETYKKRFESLIEKKSTKPVDKPQPDVSVLASIQQQRAYELLIEENSRFRKIVGNPTVRNVIEMFSYHPTETSLEATGKLSFLSMFFTRIQKSDINFDTAIVCANKNSENTLYERLRNSTLGLHLREISSFASLKNLYGVIVKHRKKQKPNDVITRTDVDLIVMYEPALNTFPDISQFKGATFDFPSVIRLATANSPEIRYLTKTLITPDIKLVHSIAKITRKERSDFLIHCIKRFSEEEVQAWNTMLADSVFEWAKKKEEVPYELDYSPHILPVCRVGKKIGCPSKLDPNASAISTPITVPKQKTEQQKQQQRQKQQAKKNRKLLEAAHALLERSLPPQQVQPQEQPVQQKRKIPQIPPSSKKQKTSQNQYEEQGQMSAKIEAMDTSESTSSGPLPDLNSIFQNALDQFEKDLNSIKIKL